LPPDVTSKYPRTWGGCPLSKIVEASRHRSFIPLVILVRSEGRSEMNDQDWLAERFEQNRGHLRAVAYRMLGSLSEADDAIQETWLRLGRSDASSIDNLGGWLTTVVARVCLDMLRSRWTRRVESTDAWLPDPIVSVDKEVDPEQEALLADSVGIALLVVL